MFIFNSERKLLFKSVSFLLLLVIVLSVINDFYMQKNRSDDNRTAKFEHINPGIVISNLGSSHGLYGFNYAELEEEYNCSNFALESQTLSYDYRVLDSYYNYLSEDGIMFVVVSFFSFYGLEETAGENFVSKNSRYYQILPSDHIKQYSLKEDIKYHWFPVINDENVLRTFSKGLDTSELVETIWDKKATEIEDRNAAAEITYRRHYVDNANVIETKQINLEELEALENIIELCQTKNIKSILITTPLLPEYREKINQDYLGDFYLHMENITSQMGVQYYDYSRAERFINNPQLFMNCDHLNRQGALFFTDIIKNEIIDKELFNELDNKGCKESDNV